MTGRVALVTGVGSGIGQATALLLAHEGARVMAADVDAEGLRETAERAEGEMVFVRALDRGFGRTSQPGRIFRLQALVLDGGLTAA
jgi:NAD(P)-dependent dehydrogenase (short-subunit alcohol dehydrogenase family)